MKILKNHSFVIKNLLKNKKNLIVLFILIILRILIIWDVLFGVFVLQNIDLNVSWFSERTFDISFLENKLCINCDCVNEY